MVFENAAAMHSVSLEGLIAYRTDVKQLYFRDHLTWRSLRVRLMFHQRKTKANGTMFRLVLDSVANPKQVEAVSNMHKMNGVKL